MKNWILLFALFFILLSSFGQIPNPNQQTRGFKAINKMIDSKLVPISVVIPEQSDFNFSSVNDLLRNKLNIIITRNGITDEVPSPRFMIYPQISVLEREYTTIAPIKTVLVLLVTLFIADYVDNKKYSSVSLQLKGVGNSDEKAYRNALKKIKNTPQIEEFIAKGKSRIIEYYNANCENLLIKANQLANVDNYSEAFWTLYSIPMFSECFQNSQSAIISTYAQYYERKCHSDLALAKKYYGQNDIKNALYYLSFIYPDCCCYAEASEIYNQVVAKAEILRKEYNLEKREWKKMQHEKELKKYELISQQYQTAIQEYKEEKQYQRRITERAYILAIENAKNAALERQRQNSILIIR